MARIVRAAVQQLRLRLRAKPPVSQEELGKRIAYAGSTVSAIERGVLRPDERFVDACERELAAGGMLRAMLPFVNAEWDDWERRGMRPPTLDIHPRDENGVGAADTGAAELARQAETSAIGSGTLEHLDRTIDRLCCDYPSTPPAELVPRIQRRLSEVGRLLDGRLTLKQHHHLLVVGGWLSALFACAQFDSGDREAAMTSRDAVFQFGKEAEHPELMAWAFEIEPWIALVEERFSQAVQLVRAGQELAPDGTSVAVQLAVREAQAWAGLRIQPDAEHALHQAMTALAKLPTPQHQRLFTMDVTKFSVCAATAYLWLGNSDAAEEQAHTVITACAGPTGSCCPSRVANAQVDLGIAALERGQPDEACHHGAEALGSTVLRTSTLGRDGSARRGADGSLCRLTRRAELPRALSARPPFAWVCRGWPEQRRNAAAVG
jgi:hypothetical protein